MITYTKRFEIDAAFRYGGTFEDSMHTYRDYIASTLFGYICGTEAEFGIEVIWAETLGCSEDGPDASITRLIVRIDGHCDDSLNLEGFLEYLKNHKACSVRSFESNHLADGHDDGPIPFWVADIDDKPYYERHKRSLNIPE